MKRIPILIPVLAGALFLTGCAAFSPGVTVAGSASDNSADWATQQVLLDAQQEADATNEQSMQDVRDATAAAVAAASANP